MNDGGEIVGMVDVLKLTYATLEQINTMSTGEGEGPAWNKFWLSIDNETESIMSGEGSHSHHHTNPLGSRIMSPDNTRDRHNDSVLPGDSASHAGIESPPRSVAAIPASPGDIPFAFKFKAPSGRTHRLQVVASQGIDSFVESVNAKLGSEVEAIGGAPSVEDGKVSGGYALSYLDDEGDSVSITTDNDLLEAIIMARQTRKDKVDLFVHDPDTPPVAPAPPTELTTDTPPASSHPSNVRERRRAPVNEEDSYDESDSEDYARRSRRQSRQAAGPEQVIAGVPNELLLPGAIVTLAAVIVGVFAISRTASR